MGAPSACVPILTEKDALCEKCIDYFKSKYDGSTPDYVACGPGRVNLIGEHTDYQGGYVFPMALDRKTVVACKKTESKIIRIHSNDCGYQEFSELPATPPAKVEWWCYVVGTMKKFADVTGCTLPAGLDMAVMTDVPLGGGLSSSAALEVATCTLMEAVCNRYIDPMDKAEKICQKAEHDWARMPCGLMDQAISTFGKDGCAMMLDCKTKERTYAPLPSSVKVVIINSGVKHRLVDGHYAKRKAACQDAVQRIQKTHPEVQFLRDCTLDMVKECSDMDPETAKRATHVISECTRCIDFAECLKKSNYEAAGQIMYEGHASLKDLYEVSVPQIDKIVEIAKEIDGVYGARITGGGFGGCVVVLVKAECADNAKDSIFKKYCDYLKSAPTEDTTSTDKVAICDPSAFLVKASIGAHLYTVCC